MSEFKHYIDSIFYQLEQTAKYCKQLGMQTFQKLNLPITHDEFIVLDTIYLHNGICQRDLAKLILKDRPSTGRLLDSLERKGYIERFADTKNNRLVRKTILTQEGTKTLNYTSTKLKEYVDKLPRTISEDSKKELISAIKKFRQSLEQEVEMKI